MAQYGRKVAMSTVKMIVTDLDDTLLRSDKSISPYTLDMLKQVRAKGIKTAFATARGASAKALVPRDLFDAHIFMNGALAFADGALVYSRTIPPQAMRPFLTALTEHKIRAAAEINGTHYANFDVRKQWHFIERFQITDFAELPGNADKLYAVVERPEEIETARALLPKTLSFHVSKDHLMMVTHKEASKRRAIAAAASKWSVEPSDIVAFGDDMNDIDMLKGCGTGIAVQNALEEVKAAAAGVCTANDHDGVAKWLEAHLGLC